MTVLWLSTIGLSVFVGFLLGIIYVGTPDPNDTRRVR